MQILKTSEKKRTLHTENQIQGWQQTFPKICNPEDNGLTVFLEESFILKSVHNFLQMMCYLFKSWFLKEHEA